MILLDTNILSELMRPSPEPLAEAWLDGQVGQSVYTSAVTEAELRYGAALLPMGRRRAALMATIEAILDGDFFDRVLPFDSAAALEFADIAAFRRRIGRPIAQADAQIAAIARSRNAVLATRNVGDFEACGLRIYNPWTTPVE